MGLSPYSLEQRFEFIKDCYKSGLSIPAWCHDNNTMLHPPGSATSARLYLPSSAPIR